EILNNQDQRQQLLQAYRQLQLQSWGVLVAEPSVIYDRQFAATQQRVKAKLDAVDSGASPLVAPTFSEEASHSN
ncbi:MAG TPA: hypothetical protein VG711_05065, partial [Phycisphaerales bacterium]|nr:hypothetical protein [Phycisphaerales bacterium]